MAYLDNQCSANARSHRRRQFFANARQVQSSLRAEDPDFTQLLESLPSLSGSRSIIRTGDETWTSLSLTPNDLPSELVIAVVEARDARSLRYRLDDQPVLAFGLQLRPGGASTLDEVAYFELVPLVEVENTLESLASDFVGWWCSYSACGSGDRVLGERWAS